MSKLVGIKTYERFRRLWENNDINEFSLNFILDTGQLYTHGIFINSAVFGTAANGAISLSIAGTTNTLALSSHTHSNYYDKSEDLDITNHKIVSENNDLLFCSGGTLYLGNTDNPTYISGSALYSTRGQNSYTILDTGNFEITNTLPSGYTFQNTALIKYGGQSHQIDYVKRINTSQSFDYLHGYTQAGTNQLNGIYYGYINFTVDNIYNNPAWAQLRINITGKTIQYRTSADANNWIDLNSSNVLQNSLNVAGVVPAPTIANPNKVWKTDNEGNPGWRDEKQYISQGLIFQQISGTNLATYDTTTAKILLAGDNIAFSYENDIITLRAQDTTYSDFVGASQSENGTAGLVIQPLAGDQNKYLRGDGSWQNITSDLTASLMVGASNGTSTEAQSTNGNVHLIFKQGNNYRRYQIMGTGRASVTSDSNGNITINSNPYSNFGSASETVAGNAGLVPAPGINQLGDNGYYLRADGTWNIPTNTWNEANTNQAGYIPQLVTGGVAISRQTTEYVLTYVSTETGVVTPKWKILPSNAFKDTWNAASFTQAGYVPQSIKGKYLHANVDDGSLEWIDDRDTTYNTFTGASATDDGTSGLVIAPTAGSQDKFLKGNGTWDVPTNTWRNIYVSGIQQMTTSNSSKGLNIVAGNNISLVYTAPGTSANQSGNSAYGNLTITAIDTWIAWKGATTTNNGTAGYMPAPTSAQKEQFLRGDGTWVSLNNYSLPTASNSTLGGIKTGAVITDTTGYTAVHIKDGIIYYKDTTYSFSNLQFQQTSGINLMTYNSQATKTVLAGSNITFTYNNNVLTIAAKDTTYSTVSKTSAGLCPTLPNEITTTKYLRQDGTWVTPPNDNTWKAANASQEGYVPKSIANKILRTNDDGVLYWGDDTNITFYNLQFQNLEGTTVDTYKPTTSPTKTLKAGNNVTISAASNVITIASANTWNANTVGVAGYVAAPTKATNANMTWQTDADGNPAWRASNNHSHSYLPLSGGALNAGAMIYWTDWGQWVASNPTYPKAQGGLQWNGTSDWIKLFAEEVASDDLRLILQFGDDVSPRFEIRDKDGNATAYISNSGAADFTSLSVSGTNVSLNGHKHSYTDLTGSGTTANQAIVSNGTTNGWTLKTLGTRAFDSTAYLPLTGGILSGEVNVKNTTLERGKAPTNRTPLGRWWLDKNSKPLGGVEFVSETNGRNFTGLWILSNTNESTANEYGGIYAYKTQGVSGNKYAVFNANTGEFSADTFIGSLTGHASLDLPLSGGTMSGNLSIKGGHNIQSSTNGISSTNYIGYYIRDVNNLRSAQYINTVSTNGDNSFWISVTYGLSAQGTEVDRGFGLTVDKQGNCTWNISEPAAFRNAIGINLDNLVTVDTVQAISAAKQFNGGITPIDSGKVTTASIGNKLWIKKAIASTDGTPNNGLVLEYGGSTTWTGQLYMADNGKNGLYWGGWYNGTRQEWQKIAFTSDLSNYLPLSGGTMTGQIKTSFKGAIATGSYAPSAVTIPNLIEDVRYSSGTMGSVNITTAYTLSGVTIPTRWYNYLWIPHRTGGVNGTNPSGDNVNYGSLLLSGMTGSGMYVVRYSNGISEVHDLYSASSLTTSRSIWGQSFNGTANVDGQLTVHYATNSTNWASDNGGIRIMNTTGTNPYTLGLAVNGSFAEIQSSQMGVGQIPLIINKNGGNVGIGNSSPSYKLDVSGTGHFTGVVDVRALTLNKGLGGTYGYIDFYYGGGSSVTSNIYEVSSGKLQINTTLNVIKNGNVGIGIESPSYKLDVNGVLRANYYKASWSASGTGGSSGYVNIANITVTGSWANTPLKFRVVQRGQTNGGEITVRFTNVDGAANATIAQFFCYGDILTAFITRSGTVFSLYIEKAEPWDTICITGIDFGSSPLSVEWKNGFATSIPSGAIIAEHFFQIGNNRIIYDSANSALKVAHKNGSSTANLYATNFYTTSDRNKKQNITVFSEHIRKFQLKGTDNYTYGVIAQEVEEMFRSGQEGDMNVNYNSVLSFYVGQLENRVKELEEKIKLLETK